MQTLLVRTGDGTERELPPGLGPYGWTDEGLTHCWQGARGYIKRVQPDLFCLHSGASSFNSKAFSTLVKEIRETMPGMRLWMGLGADARMAAWRAGEIPSSAVVGPFQAAFRAIAEEGFEVGVIDPEQAHKDRAGDARSREDHEKIATEIVEACAAAAPKVVIAITTYDHLGHHSSWPALGFFVRTRKVSLFLPQYYSANLNPKRGQLAARIKSANASMAIAERKGVLPKDLTAPDPANPNEPIDVANDVDRVPLYQLHKVERGELTEHFVAAPHATGWALPKISDDGRADDAGLVSLEAALMIRREFGCGRDAVERFQAAHGLKPDGIVGSKTLNALGVAA